MINLYNGDCLEKMKNIPDKSIDLILCDLPYGTTACQWDKLIPFKELWEQYNRIITDTGVIALFGSEPFSTKLKISNFDKFKYDWIWKKNKVTGFVHSKNMPLKDYEIIHIFSKGVINHKSLTNKRMTYNPQGVKENKEKRVREKSTFIGSRKHQIGKKYMSYTNFPKMTLEFNCVNKTVHPTQKPVDLLEYLIKTYTDEENTVLDNCMGSGSTGVACVKTNRNFIGIELDENYFNIAKKRIEEEQCIKNLNAY